MDLKKFIADLAAGYRKLTGYEAGRKAGHDAGRAEGYEAGRKAGHDEAMTPPEPPPSPEPNQADQIKGINGGEKTAGGAE